MVYEACVLTDAHITSDKMDGVKAIVREVISQNNGEVLVEDDWGVRSFAQPSERNVKNGHYLYYLYKVSGQVNKEITRRLKISESVMRSQIVKLGEDVESEGIVKAYKSPFTA